MSKYLPSKRILIISFISGFLLGAIEVVANRLLAEES